MEILLLKALHDEDFDHEFQLHKLKLESQLKTLTHIIDEKQVGITSSLSTSQKLDVSEVLKGTLMQIWKYPYMFVFI